MNPSPVEKHFNEIAKDYDFYTKKRDLHYSNLKKLLRRLIFPKRRVFEVGCGTGDLLVYLRPKVGYGMDISSGMIEIAKSKYKSKKNIIFSTKWPNGDFDYIFMSDVIEHLENPEDSFKKISNLMRKNSVFICTMMNPLWEPIAMVYEWLGLKMSEGIHKRRSFKEIEKVLYTVGLRVISHDYKLLIPIKIPFITKLSNKYLEGPFKKFAFIEYFTAKIV